MISALYDEDKELSLQFGRVVWRRQELDKYLYLVNIYINFTNAKRL